MDLFAQNLLRKIDFYDAFKADEKQAVLALPMHVVQARAGQDIVREGDRPTRSCLLIEGVMGAAKFTGEGKRQITSFYVSGDIPDLQSLHLGVMDVTFQTITSCTLGYIHHDALLNLCDRYSRLSRSLWRTTLVDAAIYREWVANVGQREASVRMAHLICEMTLRMNAVGLVKENEYDFPITQAVLGDATGLSVVHVNRTLQKLRQMKLVELKNRRLRVLDWVSLADFGDFDPTYLHIPLWADHLDL